MRRGFSVVEVLLAVALFGLLVTGLVGTYIYGEQAAASGGERARATFLADEGLQAVRNIRDYAWNTLMFTQTGLNAGTYWGFLGEGTSDTVDEFTRTITFSPVCRDSGGDIATCPAARTDANTKQVTSAVSWMNGTQGTSTVSLVTYLTNWNSANWIQTDWSGGSGQSTWSNTTKYSTDDNDINISTLGQIQLATVPDSWTLAAGSTLTDATDVDFGAGTFSQTAVEGSGSPADVTISTTQSWIEHASSTVATNQNLFSMDAVSASDIWAVGAAGKILHYNGYWKEFADMGTNVNGIDMVSASDGWAVGNSSKFYHYNGTSWSESQDLGASAVNDVVMLSSSNGWAVGDSGKFYHYNGTSWSESQDLGASNLSGISSVSASDIWAVGGSGKFYHYNGTTWSESQDIGGTQMNDVYMLSASDGWAVGNGGAIYHYNGTTWSSVTSPVSNNLNRVYMLSANDAWTVGASGKILHYNGTSWSEYTDIGATQLNGVLFINSTNGWAIGNGGSIYQYLSTYYSSGTFTSRVFDAGATSTWQTIGWTETLPTGADVTLATRSGSTPVPGGAWSAWSSEQTDPTGSTISSASAHYIQYRITLTRGVNSYESPNVGDVTIVYNSPTGKSLNDVSAISASDIWAVGNSGTILHYNGTSWSVHADSGVVTTQNLNKVAALSASDAWALGASGKFLHYNGAHWSEFTDIGPQAANALAFASPTDGWAVTNGAKIFHYNGASWSQFQDLGSANLFGIVMASSTEGWAAGASGQIYKYDGATWILFTTTGTTINAFSLVSASNIWAVGNSGKFWHYNGSSWSEAQDIGSTQLNDVHMLSSLLGWAVGGSGELYKYNGTSWNAASSPTTKALQGIYMLSSLEGWVVGNTGTILHFLSGGAYAGEGLITSSAFNTGSVSSIAQEVEWDQDVSSCSPSCSARMQLRGAPDSGGLPGTWSDWYGTSGTSTYFTVADGSFVPASFSPEHWLQYRIQLLGDGNTTPTVTEVRVNYK